MCFPLFLAWPKCSSSLENWDGIAGWDCKMPLRTYGNSTSNSTYGCSVSYRCGGCKTRFTTTANLCVSKACLPFAWGTMSSLPFTPFRVLRFRLWSCFTMVVGVGVILFCSSSHFEVPPYFASEMMLLKHLPLKTKIATPIDPTVHEGWRNSCKH